MAGIINTLELIHQPSNLYIGHFKASGRFFLTLRFQLSTPTHHRLSLCLGGKLLSRIWQFGVVERCFGFGKVFSTESMIVFFSVLIWCRVWGLNGYKKAPEIYISRWFSLIVSLDRVLHKCPAKLYVQQLFNYAWFCSTEIS